MVQIHKCRSDQDKSTLAYLFYEGGKIDLGIRDTNIGIDDSENQDMAFHVPISNIIPST